MRPYTITTGETLLTGKTYTPAERTDVVKTWLDAGWIPPGGRTHIENHDHILAPDFAKPTAAQRSAKYAQSIYLEGRPRGRY